MTRLWLDDERPKPAEFDYQATSADEAINLLASGSVTHISLDHDLGPPEKGTGYDVAKYIEEGAYKGTLPKLHWSIHSANPIGRQRMLMAMRNADRYWDTPQEYAFTQGKLSFFEWIKNQRG